MLHLLNSQAVLPNIPIRDLTFTVENHGCEPGRIYTVLQDQPLSWELENDRIRITVPELKDYCLIIIEHEQGELH